MCGAHDLPPKSAFASNECSPQGLSVLCQNKSREQSGLSGLKHHFTNYRHQTIDLVPCYPAPAFTNIVRPPVASGPLDRLSENWPTRTECRLYEVALKARDSGQRSVLSVQVVIDSFLASFVCLLSVIGLTAFAKSFSVVADDRIS